MGLRPEGLHRQIESRRITKDDIYRIPRRLDLILVRDDNNNIFTYWLGTHLLYC